MTALSSGNVCRYQFLIGKDVLPKEDLLEKAAATKRFEYSPLGSQLKMRIDIAKKQCPRLDKVYEFGETNKIDRKPTLK